MTARRPLSLALYEGVMAAAEPVAPLILRLRAARGKEHRTRLHERLGHASVPRPTQPLVWLHGVSVGESLSLLPLIDRIGAERPGVTILVTSGTVTSASLLGRRLPSGVIHQFAPIDGPKAVRRFLDHWRPDTVLFAESELWPNLILAAKAAGAKLALVSARLTEHSAKGWGRRPQAAQALLGAFDLILPQDQASSHRLAALGAAPGPILNLKHVAGPLPVDAGRLAELKAAIGARPVIFAASTHPGEERLIAEAVPPKPLLIIAPRHPDRGTAVEAELQAMGKTTARRSTGAGINTKIDVYIADTLGELGLFFSLSTVAIVCGSLVGGVGGHNPLEPARLCAPVVSGPDVFNFADVYEEMAKAKAAVITPAADLANALQDLLKKPAKRAALAAAASDYVARSAGAFDAGWALLKTILP